MSDAKPVRKMSITDEVTNHNNMKSPSAAEGGESQSRCSRFCSCFNNLGCGMLKDDFFARSTSGHMLWTFPLPRALLWIIVHLVVFVWWIFRSVLYILLELLERTHLLVDADHKILQKTGRGGNNPNAMWCCGKNETAKGNGWQRKLDFASAGSSSVDIYKCDLRRVAHFISAEAEPGKVDVDGVQAVPRDVAMMGAEDMLVLGGDVSDDEAEVLKARIRRMEGPLPADGERRALAAAGDLYEGASDEEVTNANKKRGPCAHEDDEEEKFELDVRAHCRTGPMTQLWDMGEAFDVEDEAEEFDEGVATEAETAMTTVTKIVVEKTLQTLKFLNNKFHLEDRMNLTGIATAVEVSVNQLDRDAIDAVFKEVKAENDVRKEKKLSGLLSDTQVNKKNRKLNRMLAHIMPPTLESFGFTAGGSDATAVAERDEEPHDHHGHKAHEHGNDAGAVAKKDGEPDHDGHKHEHGTDAAAAAKKSGEPHHHGHKHEHGNSAAGTKNDGEHHHGPDGTKLVTWREALTKALKGSKREMINFSRKPITRSGRWLGAWVEQDPGELGGNGIKLYFRQCRLLTTLFFYMAVATTPNLWYNHRAQRLHNTMGASPSIEARVSLGSMLFLDPAGTAEKASQNGLFLSRSHVFIMMSFLDAVAVMFMMGSIISEGEFMLRYVNWVMGLMGINHVDDSELPATTVGQFSVLVSGLDRTAQNDKPFAEELKGIAEVYVRSALYQSVCAELAIVFPPDESKGEQQLPYELQADASKGQQQLFYRLTSDQKEAALQLRAAVHMAKKARGLPSDEGGATLEKYYQPVVAEVVVVGRNAREIKTTWSQIAWTVLGLILKPLSLIYIYVFFGCVITPDYEGYKDGGNSTDGASLSELMAMLSSARKKRRLVAAKVAQAGNRGMFAWLPGKAGGGGMGLQYGIRGFWEPSRLQLWRACHDVKRLTNAIKGLVHLKPGPQQSAGPGCCSAESCCCGQPAAAEAPNGAAQQPAPTKVSLAFVSFHCVEYANIFLGCQDAAATDPFVRQMLGKPVLATESCWASCQAWFWFLIGQGPRPAKKPKDEGADEPEGTCCCLGVCCGMCDSEAVAVDKQRKAEAKKAALAEVHGRIDLQTMSGCEGPEPSNVIWENLHVSLTSRAASTCVSSIASIIILVGVFVLLVMANSSQFRLPPSIDTTASASQGGLDCYAVWRLNETIRNSDPARMHVSALAAAVRKTPTTCAHFIKGQIFEGDTVPPLRANSTAPRAPKVYYNITASDWASVDPSQSDEAHQCAALVCYGAYCSANFGDYALNRAELGSYCDTYWNSYWIATALLVGSSLIIIVTNNVMSVLVGMLVDYEKHWTVSSQEDSIAIKSFILETFNTAFITVIVYGCILGESKAGLWNIPFLFLGTHPDFDQPWYSDVGAAISRTMVLKAFVPHILRLINRLKGRLRAYCLSFFASCEEELYALHRRPEFTLSEKYGQLLGSLFVTMSFSAGLPILYWAFFINCVLSWVCDKYLLLEVCRKPPRYDGKIYYTALSIIPCSALIHCMIGYWMYGGAIVATRAMQQGHASVSLADRHSQLSVSLRYKVDSSGMQLWGLVICFFLLFLAIARRAIKYLAKVHHRVAISHQRGRRTFQHDLDAVSEAADQASPLPSPPSSPRQSSGNYGLAPAGMEDGGGAQITTASLVRTVSVSINPAHAEAYKTDRQKAAEDALKMQISEHAKGAKAVKRELERSATSKELADMAKAKMLLTAGQASMAKYIEGVKDRSTFDSIRRFLYKKFEYGETVLLTDTAPELRRAQRAYFHLQILRSELNEKLELLEAEKDALLEDIKDSDDGAVGALMARAVEREWHSTGQYTSGGSGAVEVVAARLAVLPSQLAFAVMRKMACEMMMLWVDRKVDHVWRGHFTYDLARHKANRDIINELAVNKTVGASRDDLVNRLRICISDEALYIGGDAEFDFDTLGKEHGRLMGQVVNAMAAHSTAAVFEAAGPGSYEPRKVKRDLLGVQSDNEVLFKVDFKSEVGLNGLEKLNELVYEPTMAAAAKKGNKAGVEVTMAMTRKLFALLKSLHDHKADAVRRTQVLERLWHKGSRWQLVQLVAQARLCRAADFSSSPKEIDMQARNKEQLWEIQARVMNELIPILTDEAVEMRTLSDAAAAVATAAAAEVQPPSMMCQYNGIMLISPETKLRSQGIIIRDLMQEARTILGAGIAEQEPGIYLFDSSVANATYVRYALSSPTSTAAAAGIDVSKTLLEDKTAEKCFKTATAFVEALLAVNAKDIAAGVSGGEKELQKGLAKLNKFKPQPLSHGVSPFSIEYFPACCDAVAAEDCKLPEGLKEWKATVAFGETSPMEWMSSIQLWVDTLHAIKARVEAVVPSEPLPPPSSPPPKMDSITDGETRRAAMVLRALAAFLVAAASIKAQEIRSAFVALARRSEATDPAARTAVADRQLSGKHRAAKGDPQIKIGDTPVYGRSESEAEEEDIEKGS